MTGFETLAALLLADDEDEDLEHRARRLRGSLRALRAPSAEASAWNIEQHDEVEDRGRNDRRVEEARR